VEAASGLNEGLGLVGQIVFQPLIDVFWSKTSEWLFEGNNVQIVVCVEIGLEEMSQS
jgi:hypothetical protein